MQPLAGWEGVELLFTGGDDLHRPSPGRGGQDVSERFEMDSRLASEPAANVRDVNADVSMGNSKRVREKATHRVRRLRRSVDLHSLPRQGLGDHRVRLERNMRGGRVVEVLGYHDVSAGDGGIEVALADLLVVGDVRPRLGGKHPFHVGIGPKIGMNKRGVWLQGNARIEHRGQGRILHLDEIARLARDGKGVGGDGGDWFPLVADTATGEDELVLDVQPELVR